jgi:hypothetical protein
MAIDSSFLGIVFAVVLFVAIALWYLSASTKSGERRRRDRETKHIAHQPWDGAGGRVNR